MLADRSEQRLKVAAVARSGANASVMRRPMPAYNNVSDR
jgi:hypothetical protein